MERPESTTRAQRAREDGFSVVEVVVAATIFATVLMTTGLTLLHGRRTQDESENFTRALRAVRAVFSEIQEQANMPNNLPLLQGIGAVYATHNGKTRTVADLPSGTIAITCFANETTVPVVLGGPQDLNFDGDAQDNHGGQANGSDLQLVPTVITVTFVDERGPVSLTFHRSFAQTTD